MKRGKGNDRSNRFIGGTNPYSMNVLLGRGDKIVEYGGKLEFGKYVGKRVKDVLELDPGYFLWLAKNTRKKISARVLDEAIKLSK